MEYLHDRSPKPIALLSQSIPIPLVNSPAPSARSFTSVIFWSSPHDFITKPSFTERHTISSTPLALNALASCSYLGKWLVEHVGVNAPGNENATTFFPLKNSLELIKSQSSAVLLWKVTSGTGLPSTSLVGYVTVLIFDFPILVPNAASLLLPINPLDAVRETENIYWVCRSLCVNIYGLQLLEAGFFLFWIFSTRHKKKIIRGSRQFPTQIIPQTLASKLFQKNKASSLSRCTEPSNSKFLEYGPQPRYR
mmetsp:Transcript_22094/g.48093  ORF Transcript_22094/g.48093 Transcript_22094/m.48093 type:complete len:251 (-) Transcript_22094:157-909(-)